MSLSQIAEGAYNIIRQDLQEENHVYQQLESKGFSPFHLCWLTPWKRHNSERDLGPGPFLEKNVGGEHEELCLGG